MQKIYASVEIQYAEIICASWNHIAFKNILFDRLNYNKLKKIVVIGIEKNIFFN